MTDRLVRLRKMNMSSVYCVDEGVRRRDLLKSKELLVIQSNRSLDLLSSMVRNISEDAWCIEQVQRATDEMKLTSISLFDTFKDMHCVEKSLIKLKGQLVKETEALLREHKLTIKHAMENSLLFADGVTLIEYLSKQLDKQAPDVEEFRKLTRLELIDELQSCMDNICSMVTIPTQSWTSIGNQWSLDQQLDPLLSSRVQEFYEKMSTMVELQQKLWNWNSRMSDWTDECSEALKWAEPKHDTLVEFFMDPETVCAICMDSLQFGKLEKLTDLWTEWDGTGQCPVRPKLQCGHQFCQKCMSEWVNQCASQNKSPTCPSCRSPIKPEVYVQNQPTSTSPWVDVRDYWPRYRGDWIDDIDASVVFINIPDIGGHSRTHLNEQQSPSPQPLEEVMYEVQISPPIDE